MTVSFVLEKMEKAGTQNIPVAESQELDKLRASLSAFEDAVRRLPENALLPDTVNPRQKLRNTRLGAGTVVGE